MYQDCSLSPKKTQQSKDSRVLPRFSSQKQRQTNRVSAQLQLSMIGRAARLPADHRQAGVSVAKCAVFACGWQSQTLCRQSIWEGWRLDGPAAERAMAKYPRWSNTRAGTSHVEGRLIIG